MSNHLQTLFTGRQLIELPEIDSTNNYSKELLSQNKPSEGTVIVAHTQTQGRGQAGNQWQAEAGKNISLSVIFYPTFLSADKQFFLNMAVSLGIKDFCESILNDEIKIKWPNDIFYLDKKIGGVLIENTVSGSNLQSSIIGIGLNINQTKFSNDLPNASSFAQIANIEFSIPELVNSLCNYLEKYYLQLRSLHFNFLDKAYTTSLFRYNHTSYFKKGNDLFKGEIMGVTKEGKLIIEANGKEFKFGLKEVEFVI